MSSMFKIGWRMVVIAVCALFLTATVWGLVSAVSDQLAYRSWGQDMDTYEYALQDGDYRRLKEQLASYQPEGQQFQMYWDVADAYEACSMCAFWQNVTEDPMAADHDRQAAVVYGTQWLETLQEIYDRSDATARKYIDSFVGDLISRAQ